VEEELEQRGVFDVRYSPFERKSGKTVVPTSLPLCCKKILLHRRREVTS